ncbi:MAG: polysaccharide deacetylase family protein [Dysgonamonadaceae bacterium]|jgi:peptidoglycan/xylan/chitin deacetylase (PgdA/CDA1 family)|nr:polysaccharide deacetylase family protein [Dysgonamonadaceae bacterium]
MLIEQPPLLYRLLYPRATWRIPNEREKTIYLTFDDGPVPEITPWVLDVLDEYNVKATFFCVGDNVRKYPEIYEEILHRGHRVGNHTFNHIQGWRHRTQKFVENAQKASEYIQSNLFRPPHGHMQFKQTTALIRAGYQVIMWDVVTRDYNQKISPERVFEIVKKYTRNGSIIIFHDSLKAEKNMKYALPKAIEWLLKEGYKFELL